PAFLDRADTVGKGRFDIGASMLYANPNQINGDDLGSLSRNILFENPRIINAPDVATVSFQKFDLTAFGWYLSSTYGVTNRMDVNVLLPLFYTHLSVRRTDDFRVLGGQEMVSGSEGAFGVGDLQLRAKYLLGGERLRNAVGFALRIPTGNQDDFQSIGDVT